jgi:hypothetical protein
VGGRRDFERVARERVSALSIYVYIEREKHTSISIRDGRKMGGRRDFEGVARERVSALSIYRNTRPSLLEIGGRRDFERVARERVSSPGGSLFSRLDLETCDADESCDDGRVAGARYITVIKEDI